MSLGKRVVFDPEEERVVPEVPVTKRRRLMPDERDRGRTWTISLALPGSIVANSQTIELRTMLAGQIARCLAIFRIDEVIVFEEPTKKGTDKAFDQHQAPQDTVNPSHFLARLLQYQECPQ